MNLVQLHNDLKLVGDHLLKEFAVELMQQGHNNTGSLINSLRHDVSFTEIQFFANAYGLALEKKRQKGSWIPIAPLIEWVSQKGMASTQKQIRSIAYAIRQAIFYEGIPTTGRAERKHPSKYKATGAFKYSKVGRRTAWISVTVKNNQDKITEAITKAFGKTINLTLVNAVRQSQKTI